MCCEFLDQYTHDSFEMLPLSLLRAANGRPILIELKTGDTYNGLLSECDNWMNINLREVIHTSRDGNKFWKLATCFIRGAQILLGLSM